MPDSPQQTELSRQVSKKEQRKLKARREQGRSIWYGLGMFGLVGWSIAIPVLMGIALGIWIDRNWPTRFSCTLMCLLIGLVVGCMIAWQWVKREASFNESPDDSPDDDSHQKGPGHG